MPTTPTTAFPIGGNPTDPLAIYLADIFTVQASLAGVPAISIPVGTDKDGLPIGMQILTKSFAETKLLAFSKSVTEKITIA